MKSFFFFFSFLFLFKVFFCFNYNKVITIVAFDRIKYFNEVLRSIISSNGSSDYIILISIDGYKNISHLEGFKYIPNYERYNSLIKLAKEYEKNVKLTKYPFKEFHVRIAETNLGYPENKRRALEWGFEKSDYVIFLEDDITLAPDALRWFEYHYSSGLIFNSPNLAFITCFGYSFPSTFEDNNSIHLLDLMLIQSLGLLDVYHHHEWHTPWGWATWRSVWDELKLQNWTGNAIDLGNIVVQRKKYEITPVVSRCNNIGFNGVNMKSNDAMHNKLTYSQHFPYSRLNSCKYRYSSGPFYLLRKGIEVPPPVYPPLTTTVNMIENIPPDERKFAQETTC